MTQSPQKILIVDDSPANLEILGDLMSEEYEVLCSLSGGEGLELALAEQPDLILLDVMMPFMDGYEVCRVLKGDPRTSEIPVIFVTALNHAEDETRGLELGAIDYVTKPINFPIVYARIRNHLARRRMERLLGERTVLLDREVAAHLVAREQLESLNRELKARVVHEVSKNRLKDQALMVNDKLASVGQLAAGVAHEINNPLGFICGNLGVLLKNFGKLTEFDTLQQEHARLLPPAEMERSAAERKSLDIDYILEDSIEILTESLSGAERITKIVRDLRNFSRVDTPVKEMVSLSECLESTLNVCLSELQHVTIRQEYEPAPGILCYAGDLNQALLNVLINAGQATKQPGEITLKCWSDDDNVYASVGDTGCGIPEQCRGRIFEPFFTTRDVGQGAGLGLSVAHQIVQAHGGVIRVASEVGVGTTFTLAFPRVDVVEEMIPCRTVQRGAA